jgi:hypothetical protein
VNSVFILFNSIARGQDDSYFVSGLFRAESPRQLFFGRDVRLYKTLLLTINLSSRIPLPTLIDRVS